MAFINDNKVEKIRRELLVYVFVFFRSGYGLIQGKIYLIGFIEIFVATIFPSTLRDLIAYSIILLILTLRPHGFFGQAHSTQLRL